MNLPLSRPSVTLSPSAGHYPQVVLQDTGAVLSSREDRCFAVPKGQSRIAQRFNAGLDAKRSRVPKGRLRSNPPSPSFSRPFGTCVPCTRFPGVKTPGLFSRCPSGTKERGGRLSAMPAVSSRQKRGTRSALSEGQSDGVSGPLAGSRAQSAIKVRGSLSWWEPARVGGLPTGNLRRVGGRGWPLAITL